MKLIFYIVTIVLLSISSEAQQYYLKGEVKDEAGNALQNVSILLHSTGYVYYSGSTGSFGIVTKRLIDTLSFSLDGFQKLRLPVNATRYSQVVLKRAPVAKSSRLFKLASFTEGLRRETQQQWFTGDETYASLIENRFVPAARYPSTGVTLNIDRASYSNIRRFINMNAPVPPDAVRIEEMLNYFNSNYTEPADKQVFDIQTRLTSCPWNKQNQLLFASIKSKKVVLDSLPASHLVFLIDISGSMDMPNRLPMLKTAFRGLVNNLRQKDSVSIVVYGGTVGVMLHTTSGGEKEKIFRAIDSLEPGGSTPGESGIKLAYSVARNHYIRGGNNRVILATDGDFNVGLRTEQELEEMIAAQSRAGIYLTCLGVGMGNYKDSKIQALAQKGDGNFAYIDSHEEANKVLLKEFTQTLYAVADEVYLTAKFNPSVVKEYRLIGFDNKMGAIKDTATAMEGGEIGSAYNMQVVFEIEPVHYDTSGAAKKPVVFHLQYRLPNQKKINEIQVEPAVAFQPLERMEKFYQFATSVIMFGSLLRQSGWCKELGWNEVVELAALSADPRDHSQQEFVKLVQQAKQLYGKKKKFAVK